MSIIDEYPSMFPDFDRQIKRFPGPKFEQFDGSTDRSRRGASHLRGIKSNSIIIIKYTLVFMMHLYITGSSESGFG